MALSEVGVFMNAQQLSQALGISKSGVFQLVRRGAVPKGYQVGHSRRWCFDEVRDWLRTQQASKKGEIA